MCGFAGILHRGALSDAPSRIRKMADSLIHRGPDDEGYWHDHDSVLGFRRLSIVDVGGGHQPMEDRQKSVVVVFNGEIYNHRELRRELEGLGCNFVTDHSDTEVLVHGWKQWGKDLPKRLNGMFAFAIWDRRLKSLFLARDRYGIKPLYVAELGSGNLIFGSEIRALHAANLVKKRLDSTSVLEYFSHQNLWGTKTMFCGIEMFPPGTWELRESKKVKRELYWDFSFTRNSKLSLEDAAEAHREILERVVARQVAADVPVMSYLSGGIDSSALTAAAHKLDPDIRTYACVFDLTDVGDDRIVDEREFSRSVASYLQTRHSELELNSTDLVRSLVPTITALEDPRMGMAYVNELIAGHVAKDGKVVLSGTGGDEIHGGYVYRYRATQSPATPPLFSFRRLKALIFGGLAQDQATGLRAFHQLVNYLVPDDARKRVFTPEFLSSAGEYSATSALDKILAACPSDDIWDKVLYTDAKTYLHGLLVMEDKLSMAHSLEARVPLLDNELVDFVNTLPWRHLFDGSVGKIVFRESVRPWVPESIYAKPKMGFGPPDASWYRGSLRSFIEKTLAREVIERRGIIRVDYVEKILTDHFSGAANNLPMIWSLLSFETWCRLNEAAL